jgi:riboflavin kinase / FMN adenylyltransferase
MQVFSSIESAAAFLRDGSAITIGSFDGIHIGHQSILAELSNCARENGLKSVLVTFDPHPQQIVAKADVPPLLTTTAEKLRLLEEQKLDAVVVINFTREVAAVSARDFLEKYLLEGLACRCLVIGSNHAFGHRREGNVDFLSANAERYGYRLKALDPILYRDRPVSSMRIRREITTGDFAAALVMLGHDLEFEGAVGHGKGIGKSLGFPTINVTLPATKIVPPPGVYAAYSIVDSCRRYGMMYVGDQNQGFAFEVNLFDFSGDLYGDTVSVFPTAFVRGSMQFADFGALTKQIANDEVTIRELFNIK